MKFLIILITLALTLLGSQYYSKVEPYRMYILQSNVAGLVSLSDERLEGKRLGSRAFIKIDDYLDQKELVILQAKKKNLEKSFELNSKMAENLSIMIGKKNDNYERIKNLSIKSTVEKDREFFDLATTQNQELSTLEKLETIASSLKDTELRILVLKRTIKDKSLVAKGKILYKLYVKKGQVVNAGMDLAEVADISKAKLTIYLNSNAIKDIKDKTIYLNDKKTSYKIDKIWPLTDAEHISSYKAEILIKAPKQFSSLYKIEFKN